MMSMGVNEGEQPLVHRGNPQEAPQNGNKAKRDGLTRPLETPTS